MVSKPILLTNGDSWTYGSEIMAPEFLAGPREKGHGMGYRYKKDCHDTDAKNDYYRIPRIWPTILADMLGFENINLAWPARSNDGIHESTVSWLLKNYVIPKRPTSDLMVIIGWSSPERKDVIIEDSGCTYMQTIWPAMENTTFYANDTVRKYFRFHVTHMWNEQEYVGRFIEHNHNLQLFCELHKIRYYFFNAFYQTPNQSPSGWEPMNVAKVMEKWKDRQLGGWVDPMVNWDERIERLRNQWAMISDDKFILKDRGSFKEHIDRVVPNECRMINWHPSPESHHEWARFLHEKVTKENDPEPRRFSRLLK